MNAIIKTQWHDHQGGYWEATAYAGGVKVKRQDNTLVYATMVDEDAAVASVIEDLIVMGCTSIICETQTPVSCAVSWQPKGANTTIARC